MIAADHRAIRRRVLAAHAAAGVCPACGGADRTRLGALGILAWFRCRACGTDFSVATQAACDTTHDEFDEGGEG